MAEKERNIVSWRLEKLSAEERSTINNWLDQQGNIQKSITNVILHTIDRFGGVDVMNHEIQKNLYSESILADNPVVFNTSIETIKEESKQDQIENTIESVKPVKEPIKDENDDDDNWLTGVGNDL